MHRSAQPVSRPVTMAAASSAHKASQRVEDLALEDLKDAINQVVLLQNVRSTLMDEIADLKRRVASQADEIDKATIETQEIRKSSQASQAEIATLREQLVSAEAATRDANKKAGFAEEALKISATEKDAFAAELQAVQCDITALNKDNGDAAASLANRDVLLAEQLDRIAHLEDTVSKQSDALREAKEIEKRLAADMEHFRSAAENSQTQSQAVRKAEVDMLEKQLARLQNENIRLNTDMGVAAARLRDAETEASQAAKSAANFEKSANVLKERLKASDAQIADSRQEVDIARAELAKLQAFAGSDGADAADRLPSAGSLTDQLEEQRSKVRDLEARLLEQQSMGEKSADDRAQAEKRLAAYATEMEKSTSELSQLRAEIKVVTSQNETLDDELRSASSRVAELTERSSTAETALQSAHREIAALTDTVESGQGADTENSRLKAELGEAQNAVERLKTECQNQENRLVEYGEIELRVAALQKKLNESEKSCQEAKELATRLERELVTSSSTLASCQHELASSESTIKLLEQQKEHTDGVLLDARERIATLETDLRDTRAENDTKLHRLKAKMEELSADYFEKKAEAASLDKQCQEMSRQLPQLQEEASEAKICLGKLTFEVDRLKAEVANADDRASNLTSELATEKEKLNSQEEAYTAAQTQVANLQQIVQQQQTHGCALVAQVEKLKTTEARAKELEEMNAGIRAELDAARDELDTKAAEYTSTVELMQTRAKEESERHDESHQGLVSMLEQLKNEVYAQTKKEAAMNQELGQKDHRLEDALKEVSELRQRCSVLTEQVEDLSTEKRRVENELTVARESAEQAAEATNIASTLGSDTGLMRQLLEARQDVARLKKEVKEARTASPKMGRQGAVDIKFKVQLSQAQAQAKTLRSENEKLKAELAATVQANKNAENGC
mmetsp:Transcript_21515/g.64005  ORF Transcript_21515/g.64005 Transcript_21515/m.64005 type:complete len:917 (-) Transcript_21515:190-2940(-)